MEKDWIKLPQYEIKNLNKYEDEDEKIMKMRQDVLRKEAMEKKQIKMNNKKNVDNNIIPENQKKENIEKKIKLPIIKNSSKINLGNEFINTK